ncbi:MAG: class I SAM-dependent methyltransferase [Bacteroidota bacterium]
MTAPSPVTGKASLKVDEFDIATIIRGYQKNITVDVSRYFTGTGKLPLYECPDTELRFFYPASLAGDGEFYTSLEDRSGYYDDWKWDYETAWPFIREKLSVLDIGCGRGAFIDKLKKEKNCVVHGLELNPSAYRLLQQKGISSQMQTIEDHAGSNKNKYDIVCFFQVLEHISSVKSFLDAAIECLKPGGLLIVAVPNNEPYLFGFNKYDWLNLPPHHMGWWNYASLNKLPDFFPVTVEKIIPAKFADYNNYLKAKAINLEISSPGKLKWFRFWRPAEKIWIQIIKKKIPGVFIQAITKKITDAHLPYHL